MKAFVFDTETNGLIENRTLRADRQPEIIEFYGCLADLKNGKVLSETHMLIKPKRKLLKEVIEITTITDEMLANEKPFAHYADEIENAIKDAPCVIAHNLAFDCDVVDVEFDRLSRTIKWPRKICTVEQTIHVKGFRMNLAGLHEWLFKETFAGAHRAKVDVQALLRCAVELYKREMI